MKIKQEEDHSSVLGRDQDLEVDMVWVGVSNQRPGWKLGLVCAVAVSGKAFWRRDTMWFRV